MLPAAALPADARRCAMGGAPERCSTAAVASVLDVDRHFDAATPCGCSPMNESSSHDAHRRRNGAALADDCSPSIRVCTTSRPSKVIASGGAIMSPAVKDQLREAAAVRRRSWTRSVRRRPGVPGPTVELRGGVGLRLVHRRGSHLRSSTTITICGAARLRRRRQVGAPPLDSARLLQGPGEDRGHVPHRSPWRRCAIPGDVASSDEDDHHPVAGRGSSRINTGGEKVCPEEVEGR